MATCTCNNGSPTSMLKLLTIHKLKNVDIVMTNVAKAATCGFDFRGTVVPHLRIPILYSKHGNTYQVASFLPLDHKVSGEEADQLLWRLPPATYTIRKHVHVDDMRDLWRAIAWRKCYMEVKIDGPCLYVLNTRVISGLAQSTELPVPAKDGGCGWRTA
ncbi:uncharacterized protein C2845_PM13G19370 [Panicum miliaceum]|uniref:Uncharacterized protein n=1 Tax=Panicum miliaceum TaxID=4540 RepID=A0A3L6RLX6_PANMI|nr:uncharacterized protein C2845_PM13G19370 [Panicum miliaceum]